MRWALSTVEKHERSVCDGENQYAEVDWSSVRAEVKKELGNADV